MSIKKVVLVPAILVTILGAAPATAQSVRPAEERLQIRGVPDEWGVSLASFWQTFDTRLRLDGEHEQSGEQIDVESDLGLPDDSTNFDFKGFYRFTDRSRIDVGYIGWSRSRSKTMEEQIVWGDVTYDVGATVKSELDARMLNLIYKYSFFNNGNVMFGVNAGLSSIWTEATLSGEGTISGEDTVTVGAKESASVIVPVPVVGLHFEMALVPRLIWKAEGNFFNARVSGYEGSVNELGTSLAWYFTKNFGISAGFQSTTLKVSKEGENVDGELDIRLGFSGITAAIDFSF